MKFDYQVLIGMIFFFISTIAVAQDENDHGGRLRIIEEKLQKQEAQLQDQQNKISTLLETVAAQEDVIGKLRKTVVPNIQPVGSMNLSH